MMTDQGVPFERTALIYKNDLVGRVQAILAYLTERFLGGPRLLKMAWVINLQKGGTFILYGFLLAFYHNVTTAAWIYVAMQGSYGLVWLLKANAFPDATWEKKITFGGAFVTFASVLALYWLMGWLLISRNATPAYPLPSEAWFCLCISLCILGCAIMVAADAQKYFTLRLQRGLISDGMFRYVRHPNYIGEMLIYGSFALMIWQWLPVAILAWVWIGVFATNMIMKERSMSRYPGWAAYRSRSWWLIPGVL